MPLLTYFGLFFLLELFLLIMAAVEHGWTIFWIEVATAVLGTILIQRAGTQSLRQNLNPGVGMWQFIELSVGSAQIAIAGVLLLLPGFMTDIVGAALLLSPMSLLLRLFRRSKDAEPYDPVRKTPRIIEGKVERLELPEDKR